MLRIGAVVLNSSPEAASSFWAQALGCARAENPGFLVPPDPAGVRLHLDAEDRTHLDLWTDSAAEQQAEVQRLLALGARRVPWDYPEHADFVVLADPAGTLFCIVDRSHGEGPQAPSGS